MRTPGAPVVSAVASDVVVVDDPVLLENLVKDHAAIRGLVFMGPETHEQVVDLLIDGGIVEELGRALLRLRIAGAQDAKGAEEVQRLEADELRVPAAH